MSRFVFAADRPVDYKRRGDVLFFVSVILLWGLGLFTLYVCSGRTAQRLFGNRLYFLNRQLIWSAIALVAMVVFALLPIRVIRKALPVVVIGTLLLCILTLVPGIGGRYNGAPRWISIPFLGTFQPSEFAKFAVVLFLANLFDKQAREGNGEQQEFVYPLAGLLCFVGIIILQKDLSTAFFIFVLGTSLFVVAGDRLVWLIPIIILGLALFAFVIFIESYRIERLLAFFKPDEYKLTYGYQQYMACRAITAGGFWGNGMGAGMDDVYRIPEVQSDYIFAGWANVMGLIGVVAYMTVLVLFAVRGYKISFTCENRFASLASFGCVTCILAQSLVNIAVVCGAIPTTGIPLPFFSSGGTSLLMTLCMCGFVMNASHCESDEEEEMNVYLENNDIESFNGVVVENE